MRVMARVRWIMLWARGKVGSGSECPLHEDVSM